MDKNNENQVATTILQAAYKAWNSASEFRVRRRRNKNFTYGKQLEDKVVSPEGKTMTERESILENGKEPLSNNMIRQLVKSVVGRYRTDMRATEPKDSRLKDVMQINLIDELDSRMLEEFLISGCCVQKVSYASSLSESDILVENVNVNRLFTSSIKDPRSWDCKMIGELHDMDLTEMIMRLANGDRKKAEWIRTIYSQDVNKRVCNVQNMLGADRELSTQFWNAHGNKCRVIEVWTLEAEEVLRCHDYNKGEWYVLPISSLANLEKENKKRIENGENAVEIHWAIDEVWRCRWISPMGDILAQYNSPYHHGTHPYILKLYPLTDGEVHAFVEDVIDQQKYINRLITLVDHIMNASAKGVLLYPADALPAGFTWSDVKRLWSTPNAVIPYETGRENLPQQISTNATNIGAYELLSLEMKLFEEVSGVSGALQGKSATGNTGLGLYERETQNAVIALADIFDTFASFITQRNRKITALL
ncbi:MAG: hypothetical protein PHR45_07795 [Muribaculaceae bacterium]|nr:hypothetical protein [Muribaculaceae bacterium]